MTANTPSPAGAFEPKILAFCCNWCSYAGADLAGVSRIQYPSNVRIVRVMCSGRVEIPFILRGLLAGADGVLVTGCHFGDCHYIGGNETAKARIDTAMSLLDMLGIGRERLRLEWISASEGQKFADTMREFTESIRKLGPLGAEARDAQKSRSTKPASQVIKETKAYNCLSCGKCSGICPVTRNDPKYLPRSVVERAVVGGEEKFGSDPQMWACLTCGKCETLCPSNVSYVELIRQARASSPGEYGECAHLGLLQDTMRLMASPGAKQRRMGWVDGSVKLGKDSDTLYFTGCIPYFSLLFADTSPNVANIARSAIRVLNKAGIQPQVLENERCCGHDLLWNGDEDGFCALAEQNIAALKGRGIKRIVFSCPECYRTFKKDYPERLGKEAKEFLSGIEMLHITEFADRALAEGKLKASPTGAKGSITFHDPCRLGHHMGIYDSPRKAISAAGGDIAEMRRSRDSAVCCGTSTWLRCDSGSKKHQQDRLAEAADAADRVIVACPKCLIHLECAQRSWGEKEAGAQATSSQGAQGHKPKVCVEDFAVYIDRNTTPK